MYAKGYPMTLLKALTIRNTKENPEILCFTCKTKEGDLQPPLLTSSNIMSNNYEQMSAGIAETNNRAKC